MKEYNLSEINLDEYVRRDVEIFFSQFKELLSENGIGFLNSDFKAEIKNTSATRLKAICEKRNSIDKLKDNLPKLTFTKEYQFADNVVDFAINLDKTITSKISRLLEECKNYFRNENSINETIKWSEILDIFNDKVDKTPIAHIEKKEGEVFFTELVISWLARTSKLQGQQVKFTELRGLHYKIWDYAAGYLLNKFLHDNFEISAPKGTQHFKKMFKAIDPIGKKMNLKDEQLLVEAAVGLISVKKDCQGQHFVWPEKSQNKYTALSQNAYTTRDIVVYIPEIGTTANLTIHMSMLKCKPAGKTTAYR